MTPPPAPGWTVSHLPPATTSPSRAAFLHPRSVFGFCCKAMEMSSGAPEFWNPKAAPAPPGAMDQETTRFFENKFAPHSTFVLTFARVFCGLFCALSIPVHSLRQCCLLHSKARCGRCSPPSEPEGGISPVVGGHSAMKPRTSKSVQELARTARSV